MRPRICDSDRVTIEPCDPATITVGEVVLVKLRGQWLLHLVTAVEDSRIQIGNNHGKINGWTERSDILGRVAAVDRG